MKRSAILPLAAFAVAACAEQPATAPISTPSLALTNPALAVENANAMAYGTFSMLVNVAGGARILGADGTPEIADFPGKADPGYCIYGTWYNPQSNQTSGDMEKPHPHCVVDADGVSRTIVLEGIPAKRLKVGNNPDKIFFSSDESLKVESRSVSHPKVGTTGTGVMEAWAIDAVTGERVGRLTIDLATEYDVAGQNIFVLESAPGASTSACGMAVDGAYSECLNKTVSASYVPEPDVANAGTAQTVTGFIYWSFQ